MLRLSSDDFPAPSAIAVEWQEAGVVLFVDVCRSAFEMAAPAVWMLSPPAPSAVPSSPDSIPAAAAAGMSSPLRGASASMARPSHEYLAALSAGGHAGVVSALAVSPASVTFRCTTFVPKIVNNVLFLFIGDAHASRSAAAAPAAGAAATASPVPGSKSVSVARGVGGGAGNNSAVTTQPFFGVCASLLPPPAMVQQHGADAFSAFAFAWLCGPDVTAMRPAARVGFACCVTHVQDPVRSPAGVLPVASVWVHGGVPFVPRRGSGAAVANGNSSRNAALFGTGDLWEPLSIVPAPQLAGAGGAGDQQQQQQQQLDETSSADTFIVTPEGHDRYLKKAVSEDFYGLYELRLAIGADNVSVWPWQRHPGLPLLCNHSLCGTFAPPASAAAAAAGRQPPEVIQAMVAGAASPFAERAPSSSSGVIHGDDPLRGNVVLAAFGGLRLSLWRSARADLLPPFHTTTFAVSSCFFYFDVAADAWEWRDALSSTDLAAGAATEGSYPIVGPRPPPVFEHRLVHHSTTTGGHTAVSGFDTLSPHVFALTQQHLEQQQQQQQQQRGGHLNEDSPIHGGGAAAASSSALATAQRGEMFFIAGGLRGRFAERSKEMWVFSPQLCASGPHIESCQHTGPPTVPTHLVSLCQQKSPAWFQQQQNSSSSSSSNSSATLVGTEPPLLWAIDLRGRKMWCRMSQLLENGAPWRGPFFISSASAPSSGFVQEQVPTLIMIPQGARPSVSRSRGDERNKSAVRGASANAAASRDDALERAFAAEQQQQRSGSAADPFLMDAFE